MDSSKEDEHVSTVKSLQQGSEHVRKFMLKIVLKKGADNRKNYKKKSFVLNEDDYVAGVKCFKVWIH